MANPGPSNFDFDLTDNFEGYVSSRDKTNVAANVLVDGSLNVYKKENGNIATRFGLKRRGIADGTIAGIKSAYEWYTSLGLVYPLRVVNATSAGNDAKLQVMNVNDNLWYDLMTGLTLTRFVFDTWWSETEKKDRVLFVNGNSNIYSWSSGFATAASGTAATLTISGTSTWAQSGFSTTSGEKTFKINGSPTVYTYTGGENTTTLTGITPALPAITGTEIIIQSVLTETNKPAAGYNNDFIKTIGNRVHVGSYTSRLVYISSSTDYTDYTVPSPRIAGSPELLTLDNSSKGISVRQGKAHISAGLSDWYVVSYQDIDVGGTLTQQTIVDKQQTSALAAALAHEFIDTVGDDIVYMSQDNQMRIYGLFRNLVTAKYPSLSEPVKQEFRDQNFTGGALRCIGDFIYITAPIPGVTYLHETREGIDGTGNVVAERFWHPPQQWNVSRIALISGVEYGHSNANPQLYQLWNTGQFHDDSPTDDPVGYDCRVCMSYRQHDRRQGLLTFDKVYVEGYILANTDLTLKVVQDYLSLSPEINILNSIGEPAAMFPSSNIDLIGGDLIGETIIGGGYSEVSVMPKFRVISNITLTDVFEYQLQIYSTLADSAWEILALGTNATMTKDQATFIQR